MLSLMVFFLGVPPAAFGGLIKAGVRKPAPEFSLHDSKGATVKLSQYKGKVVLLDFWATYCGVCKREIPWFTQFEKTYAKSGFSAIGVAMDKDWKLVRPFMAEVKINYPVVLGSPELLGRFGGPAQVLPVTYLIDRDGRIADQHIGLVNREEFEGAIKNLLAKEGSE